MIDREFSKETDDHYREKCHEELKEAIKESFEQIKKDFNTICKMNQVDDIGLFDFLEEL